MSDIGEWAERARKAQEAINELGAGPPAGRLTEHDRFIIRRARELTAPGVTTGEAWQRLAREVLRQLADVTERLAGDDPELYEPPSGHYCKACEVET